MKNKRKEIEMDFDKWAELQEQQEVFKPIEAAREELWADFSSENLVTNFPLTRAELEIYEIEKRLPEYIDDQDQMYTLNRIESRLNRIETVENIVAHKDTMWELRTDTASIIRADQNRKPGRRPVGEAMSGPCLEPGMMAELCPAFVASQPTMAVLIPYKMEAGDKVYQNGFQYIWKTGGDKPYYGTWGHSWLEHGPIIPDPLVQQMNTPTEQRKDLFAEIGKTHKYPVTIMEERCFRTALNIPTEQHTMKRIYHDILRSPRRENGEQIDFNLIVDENLAIMINDLMNEIIEKARKAEKEKEAEEKIGLVNIEDVIRRHRYYETPINVGVEIDDDEYTHICPNCGTEVNEEDGYEYDEEWYCNIYCAAEHNDLEVCNTCGELVSYDDSIYFEPYEQNYCSSECLARAIEGDDDFRMIDGYVWRMIW